jgi:tripartite-type tricarboxylate transporter receptor subunit TctC
MTFSSTSRWLAIFGFVLASMTVRAADAFPSRPITIIVPSPPGMGIDVITRYIAGRLATELHGQVIVDNRPGAGGVVAANAALLALPDGHTLVTLGTPQTIGMSLTPKPNFDLSRDFAHLAYLGSTPQVLVTNGQGPIKSFPEYLSRAKAAELNVGAASVFSASHMAMEMWRFQSGMKMNIVPYKGSGDLQVGLQSGDVSAAFDSLPAVLPFVKAGRLKAIAVGTKQRSPGLPDVPTIAELGYPNFGVASWIGYSASAKIPAAAADRLAAAFQKVFADPQTRARLTELGFYTAEMTREQYAVYVKQEVDKWAALIRTANIKIN